MCKLYYCSFSDLHIYRIISFYVLTNVNECRIATLVAYAPGLLAVKLIITCYTMTDNKESSQEAKSSS